MNKNMITLISLLSSQSASAFTIMTDATTATATTVNSNTKIVDNVFTTVISGIAYTVAKCLPLEGREFKSLWNISVS